MGIPLCVICCFSLAAFNICSLFLIFVKLINMCLGVFHLGFTQEEMVFSHVKRHESKSSDQPGLLL